MYWITLLHVVLLFETPFLLVKLIIRWWIGGLWSPLAVRSHCWWFFAKIGIYFWPPILLKFPLVTKNRCWNMTNHWAFPILNISQFWLGKPTPSPVCNRRPPPPESERCRRPLRSAAEWTPGSPWFRNKRWPGELKKIAVFHGIEMVI